MGGRVYGDEESLKMGMACGCGLVTEGVWSTVGEALALVLVVVLVVEVVVEVVEVGGRVREKQQLAFNMAVTYR